MNIFTIAQVITQSLIVYQSNFFGIYIYIKVWVLSLNSSKRWEQRLAFHYNKSGLWLRNLSSQYVHTETTLKRCEKILKNFTREATIDKVYSMKECHQA